MTMRFVFRGVYIQDITARREHLQAHHMHVCYPENWLPHTLQNQVDTRAGYSLSCNLTSIERNTNQVATLTTITRLIVTVWKQRQTSGGQTTASEDDEPNCPSFARLLGGMPSSKLVESPRVDCGG